MSNIKFVSHEEFTDDLYIREIVYLCIDDKYRVAYARKYTKNGGLFWGVATFGVTKEGVKTFYDGFMQDSSFQEKDIKLFLDKRSWESHKSVMTMEIPKDDDLPF